MSAIDVAMRTSLRRQAPPLPSGLAGMPGEEALLQRCQLHKRCNVTGHLTEDYRESIDRKMANAYAMTDYQDAKRALEKLHRQLMELNPSAARSLEEGMEETLTVHRLQLDDLLRRTLATTNPIESAFSVVERVCRRVKRWRGGDQRERWVGAGLWLAEQNFRRVKGYKHLPRLLAELAKHGSSPRGVNYGFRRAVFPNQDGVTGYPLDRRLGLCRRRHGSRVERPRHLIQIHPDPVQLP